MSTKQEENDVYIIPPNFIETGSLFGGTIKLRNAAEALLLTLLIGIPVFYLSLTLTARIIIACLTVLPAALFAIIGIGGESLSSFVINFFIYLKNRRVIGLMEESDESEEHTSKNAGKRPPSGQLPKRKACKSSRVHPKKEDFAEEFGQHKERRQSKQHKTAKKELARKHPVRQPRNEEQELSPLNPAAAYLPIQKIENGIVYTRDRRYVKIIEVIPINFLLRSAREQRSIIYSFVSYLKISPVKLQFKVLTRRADINRHLETIREEMRSEKDERCLALQKDYEDLIRRIGSKEAITRRFFIIFEYEPFNPARGKEEKEALSALTTAVQTAKTYLQQCGNELVIPDNDNEMTAEVFYTILNRKSSALKPLSIRINEVTGQYLNAGRKDALDHIPVTEFIAPDSIDYTHGQYAVSYTHLTLPTTSRV